MDLTTRCPQCGTTFAANLEQLQLRKGYIRCVQCAHIFDGYDAVVASPGSDTVRHTDSASVSGAAATDSAHPPAGSAAPVGTYAPGPLSAADQAFPKEPVSAAQQKPEIPHFLTPKTSDVRASATSQRVAPHVGDTASVTPSVVRGRREFTISDEPPTVPSDEEPSWDLSGVTAHGDRAGSRDAPVHVISNPRDDHVKIVSEHVETEPEHVRIDPQERNTKARYISEGRPLADDHAPSGMWRSLVSAVWMVAIVAGGLVFAAQLVYVFRVQLAESMPTLRPGLERMCTALDCTVAYARKLDMIVVTQSSLQHDPAATDTDGNSAVLLQLTLRNAYEGPQEWPTLVLDLKDFSGALIARKHLPKSVYLPADVVDMPFPALSERLIALPLTMQGLKVNGYQLTTFFP